MVDKNKLLYLDNVFVKSAGSEDNSIYIEGYASTTDKDRHGDVVPSSVWEAGIKNYLNNPIILGYHNHGTPIGKMVDHKIDDKGLWIKARISEAAGAVYNLVKDGILSAFSIGFRIIDADYKSELDLFVIKELELHEISVVSVPANQNTLFSLAKSFDNNDDYLSFKAQFATQDDKAKELNSNVEAESTNNKEVDMTPEQIQAMVAEATAKASEDAVKGLLAQQASEKAAAEKAAAEKAALEAKAIEVGQSGAEKLLAEVTARIEAQEGEFKNVLAGLQSEIAEKAAELEAIQKSKMSFQDSKAGEITYADKEKAVLLAKMAGKSLADTAFGRSLVEKAGAHVPSATWELEVSMAMEAEVRRRLVVAPLMRNINMQTNVMTIPVNPEAGSATWVTNAQFGTTASAGAAQTHQLNEITLNAYKVATSEYLAYEEEEDSLIVLMPIVRDAMVRRVAKSVDKAFLLGAGSGSDPVKGLAAYDAAAAITPSVGGASSIANLRALRKDLGAWGLDPAEVVYVVSTDVYYDLLDDATFQTVDKVGQAATFLTGQVGTIGNTPVLVSASFNDKAESEVGAVAFAPMNFVVGNQRGLRMDTQDLVETQRKVMVASLRTGMTQTTTNLGAGVSKLVWAA